MSESEIHDSWRMWNSFSPQTAICREVDMTEMNDKIMKLSERFADQDQIVEKLNQIRDILRKVSNEEGFHPENRLDDPRWATLEVLVYCYTFAKIHHEKEFISYLDHATRPWTGEEQARLDEYLKKYPIDP